MSCYLCVSRPASCTWYNLCNHLCKDSACFHNIRSKKISLDCNLLSFTCTKFAKKSGLSSKEKRLNFESKLQATKV